MNTIIYQQTKDGPSINSGNSYWDVRNVLGIEEATTEIIVNEKLLLPSEALKHGVRLLEVHTSTQINFKKSFLQWRIVRDLKVQELFNVQKKSASAIVSSILPDDEMKRPILTPLFAITEDGRVFMKDLEPKTILMLKVWLENPECFKMGKYAMGDKQRNAWISARKRLGLTVPTEKKMDFVMSFA